MSESSSSTDGESDFMTYKRMNAFHYNQNLSLKKVEKKQSSIIAHGSNLNEIYRQKEVLELAKKELRIFYDIFPNSYDDKQKDQSNFINH